MTLILEWVCSLGGSISDGVSFNGSVITDSGILGEVCVLCAAQGVAQNGLRIISAF